MAIADPEHDAAKGCPNVLEQDLVVIQLSLGELVDGHRGVAGIHQLAIGQGMVAVPKIFFKIKKNFKNFQKFLKKNSKSLPDVFRAGVDVIIDKQQIFISQ